MKKLLNTTRRRSLVFKFDLKMKLSILFVLVTFFSLKANDSYAQRTKISLDYNNITVGQLIDEIESKTEFQFVYKIEDVDLKRIIFISAENDKIDNVLNQIFRNTITTYNLNDRRIYLVRRKESKITKPSKAGINVPTLQNLVEGTIKDKEGNPLPGANILEKGTTNGTQADFDGNFSISIVDENAILEISYVGFGNKEVSINGQTKLFITLEEDAAILDEIVVVGYGTVKKSDLTGSVSNIDEKIIKQVPVSSPDLLLRGQVSGVNVRSTTAEPGAPVTIRIRGAGSVTSGNDPLYVIDGVPVGTDGLNTINPNDIASMDVLKDASATAIYGARGANGVIIITTKKGAYNSGNSLNYSAVYGIQEVSRKYPMMNRDEIIDYARASNDNGNMETGENVYFPDNISNDSYLDLDYQDLIFQSAPMQSHQLSTRGGREDLRYYFSGSYFNQQGVVKYSNWDRYSLKSNIDIDLTPNLKISNYLTYTYTDNDRSWTQTTSFWTGNNVVGQALMAYPFEPVYDTDGTYRYDNEITVPLLQNRGRPIPDIEGIFNNSKISRFLGNIFLEYELLKELKLKTSFALDSKNSKTNLYKSLLTNSGRNSGGSANATSNNYSQIINENTINWNKVFNNTHDFNVIGGFSYQEINNSGINVSSQGFINDILSTYGMDTGTNYFPPDNYKTKSKLVSFLGRVNYKYADKYLVTITGRSDGSSKFGAKSKWGFFPSAALAWKIDNESFMENIEFIDNAKLRASYGVTGNQEIGSYQSLSRLGVNLYPIDESLVNTLAVNTFANDNLKWETTTQTNIGFDIGFFKSRLNVILDVYHKKTTDLLLNVELPYSSGYNSTLQNTGSVENRGLEVAISSYLIDNDKFKWDVNGNIHLNRNEIVNIGLAKPFYASPPSTLAFIQSPLIDEGLTLGAFQGWKQDGLFRDQSDVDSYLENMAPEVINDIIVQPGFPKIIDFNEDGRINSADVTTIGNPYPDFEFGLTNRFGYKNFDLNFFLQGMIGHDILNVINGQTTAYNFLRYNQQKRVAGNYWTEDNPDAHYIKPSEQFKPKNPQRGTDYNLIEDGTFVRVKNITLGYTFENIKFVSRARFYFTVVNAFTFTDYYGFDPEANDHGELGGSQGLNWGIDMSSYPQSRTFSFGLDVTF